MKKIITILLALSMSLNLTACKSSERQTEQPPAQENSVEGSTDEGAPEEEIINDAQNADAAETQPGETDAAEAKGSKVLVAYFSATNTTEGVAKHIASGLQADLYEIVPEEPYTDADLNYHSDNSRTTIEMNDPDVRPAISGSVENMEQYGIVFVGYPIWWGDAPRIMSTFMESYDFSGKTIIPFCTSGSSGIGSSGTNLEKLTSGAQWLEGRRLNGSDSQDTVMEWVDSLGLDFGE